MRDMTPLRKKRASCVKEGECACARRMHACEGTWDDCERALGKAHAQLTVSEGSAASALAGLSGNKGTSSTEYEKKNDG